MQYQEVPKLLWKSEEVLNRNACKMADNRTKLLLTINEIAGAILTFETFRFAYSCIS